MWTFKSTLFRIKAYCSMDLNFQKINSLVKESTNIRLSKTDKAFCGLVVKNLFSTKFSDWILITTTLEFGTYRTQNQRSISQE